MNDQSKININFISPEGPSKAELSIIAMEDAFAVLPKVEQEEIKYVRERLDFLRVKYGSSADLAIVHTSLRISKERGQ